MSIINALLDTDLYKLTMLQTYFHQFPNTDAKYVFKCRTPNVKFNNTFLFRLEQEVNNLSELRFTDDEISYLSTFRFLSKDFLNFLQGYSLDTNCISTSIKDGVLDIEIAGPILQSSMFEIYLLAIINEFYFSQYTDPVINDARTLLEIKLDRIRNTNIKFTDFGTRRRYSRFWHEWVVKFCKQEVPENFVGTSNVHLARTLNLKPIGTMAHEFLQACQVFSPLQDSQKYAFDMWMKEYQGDLGIALSDIFGMGAFFQDFNMLYSKAFDGARHDSGDPFIWCDKLIKHYEKFKINPMTKTAVFSDSLTFPKMVELQESFEGKINILFGIGTNLTNDIPNTNPLNIVIKMVECNGYPVAKLSDDSGKAMCQDGVFLNYLKSVVERKVGN